MYNFSRQMIGFGFIATLFCSAQTEIVEEKPLVNDVVVQTETPQQLSFAERIAQKEAKIKQQQEELSQILLEQEENQASIYLQNKNILRKTGSGAGLNFTGMNLVSEIEELSKNNMPIDFTGANLTGAIFVGVSLRKANLTNTNLTGTFFYKSDLTLANLTGAQLTRTNFEKSDLSYALFNQVSMDKCGLTLNLKDANIESIKTSSEVLRLQLLFVHTLQNILKTDKK